MIREDADARRLQMQPCGKPRVVSTGDDGERPLNLEIHKRVYDERADPRKVERDSLSGTNTRRTFLKTAL